MTPNQHIAEIVVGEAECQASGWGEPRRTAASYIEWESGGIVGVMLLTGDDLACYGIDGEYEPDDADEYRRWLEDRDDECADAAHEWRVQHMSHYVAKPDNMP